MDEANKQFIGKMIHKILKYELQNRVRSFECYLKDLEKDFEKKYQKIESEYSIDKSNSSEEDFKANEFMRNFLIYSHVETNVEILRKSLVIAIYSFLEHHLNLIGNHLADFHATDVKLTDFSGGGIKRAKSYLTKVHNIEFCMLNDCWSFLSNFNKVRNCLVHTDGDVSLMESPKSLSNIVHNSDGLSLINEKQIKIEEYDIYECIDKINEFLTAIIGDAFSEYA